MNYKRILAVALTAFAGMFLYCGDNVVRAPDESTTPGTGPETGGGVPAGNIYTITKSAKGYEAAKSLGGLKKSAATTPRATINQLLEDIAIDAGNAPAIKIEFGKPNSTLNIGSEIAAIGDAWGQNLKTIYLAGTLQGGTDTKPPLDITGAYGVVTIKDAGFTAKNSVGAEVKITLLGTQVYDFYGSGWDVDDNGKVVAATGVVVTFEAGPAWDPTNTFVTVAYKTTKAAEVWIYASNSNSQPTNDAIKANGNLVGEVTAGIHRDEAVFNVAAGDYIHILAIDLDQKTPGKTSYARTTNAVPAIQPGEIPPADPVVLNRTWTRTGPGNANMELTITVDSAVDAWGYKLNNTLPKNSKADDSLTIKTFAEQGLGDAVVAAPGADKAKTITLTFTNWATGDYVHLLVVTASGMSTIVYDMDDRAAFVAVSYSDKSRVQNSAEVTIYSNSDNLLYILKETPTDGSAAVAPTQAEFLQTGTTTSAGTATVTIVDDKAYTIFVGVIVPTDASGFRVASAKIPESPFPSITVSDAKRLLNDKISVKIATNRATTAAKLYYAVVLSETDAVPTTFTEIALSATSVYELTNLGNFSGDASAARYAYFYIEDTDAAGLGSEVKAVEIPAKDPITINQPAAADIVRLANASAKVKITGDKEISAVKYVEVDASQTLPADAAAFDALGTPDVAGAVADEDDFYSLTLGGVNPTSEITYAIIAIYDEDGDISGNFVKITIPAKVPPALTLLEAVRIDNATATVTFTSTVPLFVGTGVAGSQFYNVKYYPANPSTTSEPAATVWKDVNVRVDTATAVEGVYTLTALGSTGGLWPNSANRLWIKGLDPDKTESEAVSIIVPAPTKPVVTLANPVRVGAQSGKVTISSESTIATIKYKISGLSTEPWTAAELDGSLTLVTDGPPIYSLTWTNTGFAARWLYVAITVGTGDAALTSDVTKIEIPVDPIPSFTSVTADRTGPSSGKVRFTGRNKRFGNVYVVSVLSTATAPPVGFVGARPDTVTMAAAAFAVTNDDPNGQDTANTWTFTIPSPGWTDDDGKTVYVVAADAGYAVDNVTTVQVSAVSAKIPVPALGSPDVTLGTPERASATTATVAWTSNNVLTGGKYLIVANGSSGPAPTKEDVLGVANTNSVTVSGISGTATFTITDGVNGAAYTGYAVFTASSTQTSALKTFAIPINSPPTFQITNYDRTSSATATLTLKADKALSVAVDAASWGGVSSPGAPLPNFDDATLAAVPNATNTYTVEITNIPGRYQLYGYIKVLGLNGVESQPVVGGAGMVVIPAWPKYEIASDSVDNMPSEGFTLHEGSTVTATDEATPGAVVTIKATGVEPGRLVSSVVITKNNGSGTVPSEDVNPGSEWKFTMPAEAITVTLTFDDASYAYSIVKTPSDAASTVVASGTGVSGSNIKAGTTVALTVTEGSGETLAAGFPKVTKTGDPTTSVTLVGSASQYTFTMPIYPITISAEFEED